MLDDQKFILRLILNIIDYEAPDAVFIAGDVYDKSVPSTEAVELLDSFLYSLSKLSAEVFIISGNHDSAERLAFASRLIDSSGIHIAPVYTGETAPYNVKGVNIYSLPFVKPANVRRCFEHEEINSFTDAIRTAVEHMNVDISQPNILITHQFVTGSSRTESEDISVGGADNVDASVFEPFDYVALGHIHRPQNCGSKKIRYCGTPLKYSFSEAKDKKSVTVGELGADKSLSIREVELTPKREMVELRGTYDELVSKSFYENTSYRNDYIRVTLTDEDDIPDASAKLRTVYPYLMKLDYDNRRTRSGSQITAANDVEKQPIELFSDFYAAQNGSELSAEQKDFMQKIIEKVWEG